MLTRPLPRSSNPWPQCWTSVGLCHALCFACAMNNNDIVLARLDSDIQGYDQKWWPVKQQVRLQTTYNFKQLTTFFPFHLVPSQHLRWPWAMTLPAGVSEIWFYLIEARKGRRLTFFNLRWSFPASWNSLSRKAVACQACLRKIGLGPSFRTSTIAQGWPQRTNLTKIKSVRFWTF